MKLVNCQVNMVKDVSNQQEKHATLLAKCSANSCCYTPRNNASKMRKVRATLANGINIVKHRSMPLPSTMMSRRSHMGLTIMEDTTELSSWYFDLEITSVSQPQSQTLIDSFRIFVTC